MISVESVPKILTFLTVISDISIAVFLFLWTISLFLRKQKAFFAFLPIRVISQNARILAFVVALTATGGSLFYSDVLGYAPCILCWYQRILMYPQVLLFAVGIIRNDRKDLPAYSLTFSITGACISLYHYYLQRGGNPFVPCSTVGFSESCTTRFTLEYGYVTIPIMALTAFVLLILAMILFIKNNSAKKK